ncbi:MAG: exo-alpha-sialidase, partial [Umezawaea sp.]
MRRILSSSVVLLVVLGTLVAPAHAAREPKLLSQGAARYPHAIRLSGGELVASVDTGGGVAEIYRSGNGNVFRRIGVIEDPEAVRGLCCAHLFELPRQVGELPRGTLLWAGSVGYARGRMMMRIWRGDGGGTSWRYLSTCATAVEDGGMWEPELSVDAVGRLVCHFADETVAGHSQVLARTSSADGVTWSEKALTVAVAPSGHRPGMPHVRRLPGGEYLMTYEICGQRGQYYCEAYSRTSADGTDWGDPADPGTPAHSTAGRYFAHTPTIELAPDGRIVLIGQMLMGRDGKVAAGNGATLFISGGGPRGPWVEAPAPVQVPEARDMNCPNYHPSLVVSPSGRSVLELASDYDGEGRCVVWYATGPLPK